MATWIIGGIIIGAMVFAVFKSYRKFTSGGYGGCSCNCLGCDQAKSCSFEKKR